MNLELPLRAQDRLGGHVVQGHVDGVGTIAADRAGRLRPRRNDRRAAGLLRYVVEKGSIAVDGVSLTVASVTEDTFAVSLIPETLERTNLGAAAPGTPVNLEVDVLAKYVEKLVGVGDERRLRADRGGDRGDPRRPHGRRVRRRGPRERGRPHDGGAVRHARGDQLHGHPRPRADLPVADPGALRRARARPDGGQERVAVRDALHGLDRGPRRRHHRHLGRRPRAHDPGRDRPRRAAARPRPAGPRLPAQVQARRRARAHRPDRGGRRPRAARGADARPA